MLTKQEIYDALKDDGARLQRAVNFMNRDELVVLYKERFGIDPDVDPDIENLAEQTSSEHMEEQPNSDKLSKGDEDISCENEKTEKTIPLLKFDESGWCSALDRAYSRGLYRPKNADEYIALKKYAAEEIKA